MAIDVEIRVRWCKTDFILTVYATMNITALNEGYDLLLRLLDAPAESIAHTFQADGSEGLEVEDKSPRADACRERRNVWREQRIEHVAGLGKR